MRNKEQGEKGRRENIREERERIRKEGRKERKRKDGKKHNISLKKYPMKWY